MGTCSALVWRGDVFITADDWGNGGITPGYEMVLLTSSSNSIILDNLSFNGNGQANTIIDIWWTANFTINDVQFYNARFYWIKTNWSNLSKNRLINNSQFYNNQNGLSTDSNCSYIIINNSQAFNNKYNGFWISSNYITINNSSFNSDAMISSALFTIILQV